MDFFSEILIVSSLLSFLIFVFGRRGNLLVLCIAIIYIVPIILQIWPYWSARNQDAMWAIGAGIVVVSNLLAQLAASIVGLILRCLFKRKAPLQS